MGEEGKGYQEQRCSEVYNIRGLHAVLEWRNRNAQAVMDKIHIARRVQNQKQKSL